MKFAEEALRLYAITDRSWLKPGETLEAVCAKVLDGGATFLQLREKDLDTGAFKAEARHLQALCRERNVPFVVNDSVEIALRLDADGVHVGQSDIRGRDLRAILGPEKILGISAGTVAEALAAEAAGADYLGVGAVFGTGTKADATTGSIAQLREICAAVRIPVVAIGGITSENLPRLKDSGAAGAAVISAIFAAEEPGRAAARLCRICREVFRG